MASEIANENKEEDAAAEVTVLTADQILAAAPKIGEDVVDVPEWGTQVRVRGIGRREQRKISDDARDPDTGQADEDIVEMSMFMHGVLEPKFSDEQVEALWKTAPGPINAVLLKILELSGGGAASDKTAVRTFQA